MTRAAALSLISFALVSLVPPGCNGGPGRFNAQGDFPRVDGETAFALLQEQVAFGPRVPGSDAHQRQLAWMEAYLRERADSVALQPFSHTTQDDDELPLTNVLAHFRPALPDRILLVAHWDTRPTADNENDQADRAQPVPGANDGASGVAVLLELANVLSRHSPPVGVDILLTDGEDYAPGDMYLGATHFAATLPEGYRPLYAVLVDMVGDQDPLFPAEGYSRQHAPEVVDRIWRTAHDIGYASLFPNSPGRSIMDDHLPLNRAGIPAIVIIDFDYGRGNRYWHTLEDDVHNTSPTGLEAVGNVLSALIAAGG